MMGLNIVFEVIVVREDIYLKLNIVL